jgi:hypothetical protein
MSQRRSSGRLAAKSAGSASGGEGGTSSDGQEEGEFQPPPVSSRFNYEDPATVAHVINPELASRRYEIAPQGSSAVRDSSHPSDETPRRETAPPHALLPSHGHSSEAHVPTSDTQVLIYTPVANRRSKDSGNAEPLPAPRADGVNQPQAAFPAAPLADGVNQPQAAFPAAPLADGVTQPQAAFPAAPPADPGHQPTSLDGPALAHMLMSSYPTHVLQSMLASFMPSSSHMTSVATPATPRAAQSAPPVTVVRRPLPTHEVVEIHDSPSPTRDGDSSSQQQQQGVKRGVPGHPSSSSNSAESAGQAPEESTAVQPALTSPRRSGRRAPSLQDRCPVCLTPVGELPQGHNPFNCLQVNGPRSVKEQEQLKTIAASRRFLQDFGMADNLQPRYSDAADEDVDDRPRISRGQPAQEQPRLERQQTLDRFVDPRIQRVRADERDAYAAGVDAVGSESRSRESSRAGSQSASHYSSSSYAPSSSSADSGPPSWATALASRLDVMASTMENIMNTQRRHNDLFERGSFQPPFGYVQPPFMPPFMGVPPFPPGPMGSNMPNSMGPNMPGFMGPQYPLDDAPSTSVRHVDAADSRLWQGHPPASHMGDRRDGISFRDQVGTVSPSMLHSARPRAGMRGAPELAPEDIGNVTKFNEFLQRHASYAAAAREQNQSWASVAGLLARYADDLAVAFNACALKRQGQATFDAQTVLRLTDDEFERLYLEACAPTVEYPSQVLELLQVVPFIRQQPHESSPMPAILRAAEAFRVQMRLLPARAVGECQDQALAMSFMTCLFGESAKTRANDFQRCVTWEQYKNALIQLAASNASWFGTTLLPPSGLPADKPPSISGPQSSPKQPSSVSSAASTSSQSSLTEQQKTQQSQQLADRVERLRQSGELKGLEIEGLSNKQILKLANKARWKTKIGEQAVAESRAGMKPLQAQLEEQSKAIAMLTQQLRQRGESRERREQFHGSSDRPRDAPQSNSDRSRDAPQSNSFTKGQQPVHSGGAREKSPGKQNGDAQHRAA